jgi:hypothetical protein
MNEDRFRAAVAAGVLAAEEQHRALLRSIVEVARSMFAAAASSIVLLDEEADELVFEAVAGEGEDTLVGQRFSSSKGISGWVLSTRQPLVIDDVRHDPRHARDVAEQTGYVPEGLMAVPLLHEEAAAGCARRRPQTVEGRLRPPLSTPNVEGSLVLDALATLVVVLVAVALKAVALKPIGLELVSLDVRLLVALGLSVNSLAILAHLISFRSTARGLPLH